MKTLIFVIAILGSISASAGAISTCELNINQKSYQAELAIESVTKNSTSECSFSDAPSCIQSTRYSVVPVALADFEYEIFYSVGDLSAGDERKNKIEILPKDNHRGTPSLSAFSKDALARFPGKNGKSFNGKTIGMYEIIVHCNEQQ